MSLCASFPVAASAAAAAAHTQTSCAHKLHILQHSPVAGAFPSFQCRLYGVGVNRSNEPWLKQCTEIALQTSRTRIKASQEGVPKEILDDSKFVPINDDDPRFGPPAMLLLGFNEEEVALAQEMLTDMGGDFMKVLLCTDEMAQGTLNEALNSSQPDLSKVEPMKGLPHICFFSGLSGEELMMLVRAFPEAGLTGTAFAAHVPKNSHKQMEELIEEIMGDHERLSKPQQPAQA